MSTQGELFGFHDTRPKPKIPISAERIREVQAMIRRGDGKNAAIQLREIRYGLENYERRLKNR